MTELEENVTLFPGMRPLMGCNDSNNWLYLSLSAGFIDQSLAGGGGTIGGTLGSSP